MAAAALDIDHEAIRRRHDAAHANAEMPSRDARPVVHAVDFVDAEALENAVLDHFAPAGAAFFGRLEDQGDSPIEVAGFSEILGCAQQHGCVTIMAAGMHAARHRTGVRLARAFGDRQGIHIRAQAQGAPAGIALAIDDADNAGPPQPGHDLVASKSAQEFLDLARRAMHLKQDLGIAMQVLTPASDLVVKLGNAIDYGHEKPENCSGSVSLP
ncbi:MAG: hypothetical protein K0R85_648 [Devosia sp.]|nr:hypothetical protein [Devosia sp.]